MSVMTTLARARRVIDAAERKAVEIGQPMSVAVVDSDGDLVSHVRMDGAWTGSIAIAIDKAFTSWTFNLPTKYVAATAQASEQLCAVDASKHERITFLVGGIPLRSGNEVVGAVGVSGGTEDQDHTVAEASAADFV